MRASRTVPSVFPLLPFRVMKNKYVSSSEGEFLFQLLQVSQDSCSRKNIVYTLHKICRARCNVRFVIDYCSLVQPTSFVYSLLASFQFSIVMSTLVSSASGNKGR